MLYDSERHDRWIAAWLIGCAIVIFGMILLGGVTRLTDSGLSMVEWQPIMGIIPPLSEADWQIAFAKYQRYPEYLKINAGMDLDGFKVIFMYEYLHRVLGRLIGVLFFVPLVFFAARRMIRPGLLPRLLGLLILGGCQGLLGWYMVQSGLVDRPDVSQYRLTAHLGLAIAIYAAMLWVIFDLLGPDRRFSVAPVQWPLALVGLVYVMILSGGFVAGTDAGYAYPTWPLMGDSWVPPLLWRGGWIAAFEDVTTIHFNHRLLAYIVVASVVTASIVTLRRATDPRVRRGSWLLLLAVAGQLGLGIATVLSQVAVPVAAAHQSGAVLLLSAVLFWAHARRAELVQSKL